MPAILVTFSWTKRIYFTRTMCWLKVYIRLINFNEQCYTAKAMTTQIDLNETVKDYFLELWVHLVLFLCNVDPTPGKFLFIKNP